MSLIEFLNAAADAVALFEPDVLHPYDDTAYALAEAQQHAKECAQ
ncbi:hypothetical protein [Rhizobacter sp. Root1221]|nr:hypothetical protein [Rhizobacter sp. Root1221]